MGMRENTTEPPAPRAPAVVARLKVAQRELADLKLQIPEHALAVAEGKLGAKESLSSLHQKITAVTFEIEHGSKAARELAARLDEQAIVDWRAQVQMLPVAQIVDGIGREVCPRLCGAGAGCVISGSDVLSGPCCHPLKEGLMLSRYRENAQIMRVWAACCAALKIRSN
jgi:hypothetical protein